LAPPRRAGGLAAFARKVLVPPAATAASPSTRARYGLPWPVVALPLVLPADCLTPGANFAQEARWPGVGKRPMSRPISAMITWAAVRPTPQISSSRSTARAKGATSWSILASSSAMSALAWSMRPSILASRKAGWSRKWRGRGGAPAGARQLRQRLGVRLACDECGQHVPTRDPEDVGGDHRQFDLGVLQQLLDALLLGGAHADQGGGVGVRAPQPADRGWRHEAGPQHLPLGDLGEPDRVQPVGLGPTRQGPCIARGGHHRPR